MRARARCCRFLLDRIHYADGCAMRAQVYFFVAAMPPCVRIWLLGARVYNAQVMLRCGIRRERGLFNEGG